MGTKLGQNFLKNKEIARQIVEAANLNSEDMVLEIGPGKGILTEELAKQAGKVIAVELDKVLYNKLHNKLHNKFSNKKNVEIIQGDILKTDLQKLIADYRLPVTSYKVIANLPYYITSPAIRMFLESKTPPMEMVLMVQKEVAERIVAGPGNMSMLSVAVQYYAEAGILFEVGRENFDPVPEVDSSVIRIFNYQVPISNEVRNKFFQAVRAGFCAKRKTLVNNLSNSLHLDKKIVEEKLSSLDLDLNARAQELSVDDWRNLSKSL